MYAILNLSIQESSKKYLRTARSLYFILNKGWLGITICRSWQLV